MDEARNEFTDIIDDDENERNSVVSFNNPSFEDSETAPSPTLTVSGEDNPTEQQTNFHIEEAADDKRTQVQSQVEGVCNNHNAVELEKQNQETFRNEEADVNEAESQVKDTHKELEVEQHMSDMVEVKKERSVTIDLPYLEPEPPQLTRLDRLDEYISSPNGQDLTRSLSGLYAMLILVVAIALVFSNEFSSVESHQFGTQLFYSMMYLMSSASIICILILALFEQLTSDFHYRQHGSELFLRAGATVLGTGGIIHEVLKVVDYFNSPAECKEAIDIVNSMSDITFILLEIILLLNFAKVHMNKTTLISTLCRFFCMQLIATNICVWIQTVVIETVEEIHHHGGGDGDHHSYYYVDDAVTEDPNITDKCANDAIGDLVAPVLFPLKIEYSVVAATMVIAMWEKCGLGQDYAKSYNFDKRASIDSIFSTEERDRSMSVASMATTNDHQNRGNSKYYNNHFGFVIGYLTLCSSIAIIIVYYYALSSDDGYTLKLEEAVYSFDMAIKIICLITVPLTLYKMSSMTTKDKEIKVLRGLREHKHLKVGQSIHRSLDKNLLTVTFFTSLLFHMFTMIAAMENNSGVLFTNAFMSMMLGFVQTLFINWYGFQKRATKEKHHIKKPGRQGLEILRCCNLALWATGTFIVKHPEAKRIHINTFGFEAWMIISNITQPLTILYHFHSVACIAEIISHAYTSKYLGIKRGGKSIHNDIIAMETIAECTARRMSNYGARRNSFGTETESGVGLDYSPSSSSENMVNL